MKQTDKEKFIGLVKWFHDQARNANYGFIQHAKLGDLFFHERSIEQGQDLSSFRENAVVVFVAQESRKHTGKLEAINVKYLETENDLNFLFNHFLSILTEKSKYSDYNIIQRQVHQKITSLFETTNQKNKEQLFDRFKNYVAFHLQTDSISDEEYIKGLLKVCKGFFIDNYNQVAEIVSKKISVELAHKLWLEKFLENCQIDFIASTILSESEQTKRAIFRRCTEEDKSNIFFKVLYSFETIDSELKLDTIKEFLKLSKEFASEQHDKILTATLKVCPEYFKLNLWLENFHDDLDFHSYKLYTITLSPQDQKKFVKKVLKYIHEEKAVISIEELTSINLIDYETSKQAQLFEDNSHLDYSTSVILNVIHELHTQTKLETRKEATDAQHRIYDLIIKQIKEPNDILQITGFFDECEGRCNISVHEEKNESGEVTERTFNYHRNEHNKPKLHFICDGRKALNKATGEPILSEEGAEYWWCANQKCFKPTRELHSSSDWEKYSLYDFLTILKAQYKQKDFELYLNLINKVNRFLNHLKCRKCNHILRPVKQSNYAFYGVNDFHCTNDVCEDKNKKIYLTHCLNGKCEQAIDSRDAVKCKPDGFEADKCGWYVCNYCHSCCSDEGIGRRVYILERTGQQYKCHTKGHRNLGVICCNKCGSPMNDREQNQVEYDKVLKWFMDNRENEDYIAKSGQTKKGKWWFRFKKNNLSHDEYYQKLTNLLKLGFHIPNFEEYEREVQLVSEGDNKEQSESEILICSNTDCGNILDLSNDLEKSWTIKRFHNVRFKQPTAAT